MKSSSLFLLLLGLALVEPAHGLLAEIVELVGQGKNSALGAVHARLAQLALHLRAYV